MLKPADSTLFYRRGDPDDSRLGESVVRWDGQADWASRLSRETAALIGWPDDRGVALNKGRTGAKEGPDAIRNAFYRLTPGITPSVDPEKIVDVGNLAGSGDLETSHSTAADLVQSAAKTGATLVTLGGGNDYAYADLAGLHGTLKPKSSLGAINIDAHFDVRDLRDGPSSGTPYYRCLEGNPALLDGRNFVEFAIQPHRNAPHHYKYVTERNVQVVPLDSICVRGAKKLFFESLTRLVQTCEKIVVSLDIDSVRQADAPGCSAPSPNGLTAQDVEQIALLAGAEPKVQLFSVYEVSPRHDRDRQTATLAASVVWFFLTGFFSRPPK